MNVTLAMHEHAQRCPQQRAVVTQRESLTYGQLDALVWRAARYFREHGLRQGDRAALLAPDSLLHLVAALGLSRLGVAYYAIGENEPIIAINSMLSRIDAKVVLVAIRGPEFTRPQLAISAQLFFSTRSTGNDVDFALDPTLIWRFITSSGTTGRPKLFGLTHANMAALICRLEIGLPKLDGDVSMAMSGLSFFSATRRIVRHLSTGGTVVLPGNASLSGLTVMIANAGINRVLIGPWLLPQFLAEPAYDTIFQKIKVLECGGSIIGAKLRREVLERYTEGLTIIYGTNEVTPVSTANGAACLAYPDTIGKPVPQGNVEVIDEAGETAAPGVVGQIRVRDAGMVSRYWDDDIANATAFRDGWFYPGDLACRTPQGELLFKGRADDMIILDGINIYPSEIENCLLEHPAVIEAAAFGLDDERRGGIPIAAVRLAWPVQEETLMVHCQERLGIQGPRAILILGDFPRNPRGKVLKKELARLLKTDLANY